MLTQVLTVVISDSQLNDDILKLTKPNKDLVLIEPLMAGKIPVLMSELKEAMAILDNFKPSQIKEASVELPKPETDRELEEAKVDMSGFIYE